MNFVNVLGDEDYLRTRSDLVDSRSERELYGFWTESKELFHDAISTGWISWSDGLPPTPMAEVLLGPPSRVFWFAFLIPTREHVQRGIQQ